MLLNRTNLTLSALALSNGLNLGTRSLAVNASVNDGDLSLRIRHSHQDVMRERMVWYVVSSIPKPTDAIPAIPSSFSQQFQQPLSRVTLPQGYVAVTVCVEPESRPADLVGRLEPCVLDRDPSIGTIVPSKGNPIRGASGSKSRPGLKSAGIYGLKRTARRAARPAAAAMSATFGK
jgi:hypothetical protein